MPLSHPLTTLTDYAIALECLLFAGLLLVSKPRSQAIAVGFWVCAFGCVAIAALTAGTSHGFLTVLDNERLHQLWVAMVYALSGASFCMLAGTVMTELRGTWQRLGLGLTSLKSIGYWAAIGLQDSFTAVAIDYLSAMILVLLLHSVNLGVNLGVDLGVDLWGQRRRSHSCWCIAGVIVSGIASAIQASGLEIIQVVTHNDLYHLVQMLGLYCFYRSIQILKKSGIQQSQENFN